MKKSNLVLLLITLTTLSCFTSLNAQWYDKTNGLSGGRCDAIDAYDSLIATGPFTTNPNLLYLTSDGGNSWFSRPLPGVVPIDISIKGENNIWFCTGSGKIYSTIDGGFNWQLQFYDTLKSTFINYIEMFDSLNGMAMGDAPANDKPALFLKTTNGGIDWISQNDSSLIGLLSGNIWRRVDFVDVNIGYFFSSGESPQKLYKTTNSGKNWTVINDTIYCFVLKGYNENIFLSEEPTATTDGIVHRTIDGGQNWEIKQWEFLDWGSDIEYIPGNPSNVWCASSALSFSSDTGKTWVKEFDNQNGYIGDIVFTDENTGWFFSGGGGTLSNIYRTTNGGHGGIVSVDDNAIDFIPDGFILGQNFPNPFNPTTTINYQIPASSFVTIKIYDVLGKEIKSLVNEEKTVGSYELTWYAEQLPSGIYFYRLQAGSFVETKKMVFLK